MMERTLQETFEGAYEVLAPDGIAHLKGTYGSAEIGGFCAVGALRQALAGSTRWRAVQGTVPYAEALALMQRKVRQGDGADRLAAPVVDWNDAPERTKADVLALFRTMADQAAGAQAQA